MFENYESIDDLMQSEARYTVQQELNANSLYVSAVRCFRFRSIGIVVLDDLGNETARYASHNCPTGEIVEIVSHFERPDITVRVPEHTLLTILKNIDQVKEHPLRAFFRYAPEFSMAAKDKMRLLSYMLPLSGHETQLPR